MTLLVRDEADVVDAQIAFHLHAGVDFVIATDNASSDGTTEILERYERAGILRLLREPGDEMRQAEWVTPHGAPRGDRARGGLGDQLRRGRVLVAARRLAQGRPRTRAAAVRRRPRLLAPLPAASRRRRLLRRAHDRPASRPRIPGTRRRSPRAPEGRASGAPGGEIEAGNHNAEGPGLEPLRAGTHRGAALLVPLGGAARAQGAWRLAPSPGPRAGAAPSAWTRRSAAADVDAFYEALAVSDAALAQGLADGTLAVDTRLRDALRDLRATTGAFRAAEAGRPLDFPRPPSPTTRPTPPRRPVLVGIDGIVRAEQRVEALAAARGEARAAGPS